MTRMTRKVTHKIIMVLEMGGCHLFVPTIKLLTTVLNG